MAYYCCHDNLYWKPPHHLIYREELKEDGEKKVICWCCQEPIWGSLHNCVECCNRPVHNYSSYINHCLDFTEKLENEVVCSGCHEPILGPAYKCSVSKCNFFIHKSCTELSQEINCPLHLDHALFLEWSGRESRCDACCTSHDRSFFYSCGSCGFKLDVKCANYSLAINPNDCHQHEFSLIRKLMQYNCEACGEKLITNLPYNECNICKLFVHIRCAEIPRKVKIKLHNHFFNLIYSPREINNRDSMFCRICADKVSTQYAAYYCQQQCSYILHMECLRSFRNRYGESPESMPNKFVSHVTHLIKVLNQAEDEGPHLGTIQHFSHQQHKLILCNDEIKDYKLCERCMEFITSIPFYSCAQRIFFFHTRCVELPTTIEQYRLHDFLKFTLLPLGSNKNGVFFCDLCSRHHRGFTYKCNTCWMQLDIQCASIPETLKHEGHQHLFYFAQDSKNRKCRACPKDNEDHVFVCTGCDFILGIKCANLPLVARHKYDTHLFKLTYAIEDDFREYYCLICEEKRNPNHWFYYCKECDFPAHTECVLGNYPCITIESTYKSEYHEHPLTFVQTTKDSPICDGCYSYIDGVALECSECKFKVHPPRPYYRDCMWIRSEGGW